MNDPIPPPLLLAMLVVELIRSREWTRVAQSLPPALVEEINDFLAERPYLPALSEALFDMSDSPSQAVH